MVNNKDWTFGICCGGQSYLSKIIESIRNLQIPKYEILLIGSDDVICNFQSEDVRPITFDETQKGAWITRKKNILCEEAMFDNISILHDYISFDVNWYENFLEFDTDWNVCMNRMINTDGSRYRDWITWDNPIQWVDYKDETQTGNMYVSGTYWCCKKKFMLDNPLDETKSWGEGEDVEWSLRVRENDSWKYKCNWKSKVFLEKSKSSYLNNSLDPNLNIDTSG
jgi:hypothetical protein